MKKTISLLLCLALLAALLSGCAGKPEPTPAPVETEAPVQAHRQPIESEPEVTENPAAEETPAPVETPAPTLAPELLVGVSPLMWKVTDAEGHTLYLFGTIHVGDERNEAVLHLVEPVLGSCDALAVEFDTKAYTADTQLMMQDMAQYVLTDGSEVSDYMPEELYARAYALLEEAGLYPAMFKRYNIAMWYQLIESAMIMQYTELDSDCGMDSLLIERAYELGKPVLDVESGSFQMALLNSFDDEVYRIVIKETLDMADSYGESTMELYELWLSGDRDAFWAYLAGEDVDETDYSEEQIEMILAYNRALLDERNLGMRDKALEYLASGQTVFFAVGAAHMANEVGLVYLLSEAGYTVEPFDYISFVGGQT